MESSTFPEGGSYPVRYALRLAAGFGSQISMVLLRWVPAPGGQRPEIDQLGYDYRRVEPERWRQWLDWASGHPGAEVEVEHRTLRVRDEGTAEQDHALARKRSWQKGQAPRAGPAPSGRPGHPDPGRHRPERRPPSPRVSPAPWLHRQRMLRRLHRPGRPVGWIQSRSVSWRSWRRPPTWKRCWIWIWTWRPIWGSTR